MDSDSSCSIEVTIAASGWTALVTDPDALCRSAAKAALDHAGMLRDHVPEIGILLTDDAEVRELNRVWRHQDKPTNVLSFPSGCASDRLSGGNACAARRCGPRLETVRAEAIAERKRPADHLAHLVVHGVLHLLGHDHETVAEANLMEALESTILTAIGVPDPWADEAA